MSSNAFSTDWCADASCVGCWLMEVDEDPQTDSSGEGHTVAVVNAVYTTTTPPDGDDGFNGTSVGYFHFDGTGDYLNGTAELVSDGWEGGWTAGAWTKSPDGSTRRFIIETEPNYPISVALQTDGTLHIYSHCSNYSTTDIQTSGQYDDNTWHHLYGTFTEADHKVRAYADGVLAATASVGCSAAGLAPTAGFHIGTYRNANDRWMVGDLDEVAVFSDTKDSTDINDIMDRGLEMQDEACETGWLLSDGRCYTTRKKITNQTAYVDADLADFPLLVQIDGDTDIGAATNADGHDIRFTSNDEETLIPYERESHVVDGEALTANYWVKTPVTTAGTGATDIYIYYRAADTSDIQNPTQVWDDNYDGVWHMKESSGNIADSTSNKATGTQGGTPVYAQTGKVGNAIEGNASGTFNVGVLNTANVDRSISYWLSANTDANGDVSMGAATYGSGNAEIQFGYMNSSKIRLYVREAATVSQYSAATVLDNTWHHVAATMISGGNAQIYVDGAPDGDAFSIAANSLANAEIWTLFNIAGANLQFAGLLDEVRISSGIARSAAWLKFEYYNMNETDNELDWGAEETPGEPPAGRTRRMFISKDRNEKSDTLKMSMVRE